RHPGLLLARLPTSRLVDTVGVNPGIDPAPPAGGTIGSHVGVGGQRLPSLLTGEMPSVDLLQDGISSGLTLVVGRVVPGQLQQRAVALEGGPGQTLAEFAAELVKEVQLAAAVTGWFQRLVVPLQHPLGLGERAVLLDMGGRREEEDFGAD